MRYEKINLTVKYKENYLDIRIANSLTWFRLEKLLYENVVANLSFPLDGQMHLQVKDKNIHIEKSDSFGILSDRKRGCFGDYKLIGKVLER